MSVGNMTIIFVRETVEKRYFPKPDNSIPFVTKNPNYPINFLTT